jgi:FPC/CPF motif-containing protein YcgG
MLHAFATDDFLKAVNDFDRHARHGGAQASGNSCRKGRSLPERVRFYPPLGDAASAMAVCRDLWALSLARPERPSATLVAIFEGPPIRDARHFESLMWQQLQTMHGVDAQHFDWRAPPAGEVARPVFSIGGRAWQVRGVMPTAEQAWPRLVFQSRRG